LSELPAQLGRTRLAEDPRVAELPAEESHGGSLFLSPAAESL
jgi:hypothetical protein